MPPDSHRELARPARADWRAAAIAAGSALLLAGLYMALLYAPEERTMGAAQRIFYVHVPAAWVGFLAFAVVCAASVGYLGTRRRAWDLTAHASTEVGVVFTTLAIASGSVWGRYAWGTWWSWDPRLTTTFLLWFIYVASLMVRAYGGTGTQPSRFAAVLGIVGFLDIPLIYLSVLWWRSLHPLPVVVGAEGVGSGLHPAMLHALVVNVVAFTILYVILVSLRREQMVVADRLTARAGRSGVRAGAGEVAG